MSDVSKCNRTKAVPADEARRSEVSKAEWVEAASHLLDKMRDESGDAGSVSPSAKGD